VISELRKGRHANAKVRRWAAGSLGDRHLISVLSLGEIRKGIELLRRKSPAQCPAFERWLAQLQTDYARNIIPVSEEIAQRWGRVMAVRTLPVIDGLLAATALEHDLTIATRNLSDFRPSGVQVFDPFE